MGNGQAAPGGDGKILESLKFVKKIRDERFGDITLMEDLKSGQIVGMKERSLNNAEEFKRELADLGTKRNITHPNIIRLLGVSSSSQDTFCATFHKITAVFELIDNDLEKEISKRKERDFPFREDELWALMDSVVSALAYMQSQKVSHGDLRPSAIFITPEGEYKIANQSLLNSGYNAYVYMMMGNHNPIPYLSPKLLANLARREANPQHNSFKSDVWALAMTLLNAGLLSSNDGIYNWNRGVINDQALNDRIAKFGCIYSDVLSNMLRCMLEVDEDRRPDFLGLDGYIQTAVGEYKRRRGNMMNVQPPIMNIPPPQPIQQQPVQQGGYRNVPSPGMDRYGGDVSGYQQPQQQRNMQQQGGVSQYNQLSSAHGYYSQSGQQIPPHPNTPGNTAGQYPRYQGQPSGYQGQPVQPPVPQGQNGWVMPPQQQGLQSQPQPQQRPPVNPQQPQQFAQQPQQAQFQTKPQQVQPQNGPIGPDMKRVMMPDGTIKVVPANTPLQSLFQPQQQGAPAGQPQQQQQPQGFPPQQNGYGNAPLNPIDQNTQATQQYGGGKPAAPGQKQGYPTGTDPSKQQMVYRMAPNGTLQQVPAQQPGQENRLGPNGTVSQVPVQQQQVQGSISPMMKATTALNNINTTSYLLGQAGQPIQGSQPAPAMTTTAMIQPQRGPQPPTVNNAPSVTENYEDGSVYIGQKIDGYRHGKGKFYYADGGMYEGDWKYGSMDGYGRLFYVSGSLAYDGEWREDKFYGKGTVYNEFPVALNEPFNFENFDLVGDFWVKYEGDFVDDNKDGVGTLFLANNERYAGEFVNDATDGKGTYYRIDGSIIAGEWRNNHLVRML